MFTETLTQFINSTKFDTLPQEVIELSKLHILDTVGVILAGSRMKEAQMIQGYIKELAGSLQASVIGGRLKTSAPLAALANGVMGHILDFDDDSDTLCSHPSCTLVPAVLALGENTASGRDTILAYVVAEELEARIASVPGFLPEHYEQGWHPSSTLGVIGAAAAGAKILNLKKDILKNAIGLAISEASGLRTNFGSTAKSIHAGSAAQKGVSCALLAQAGARANPRALEDAFGFLEVFGPGTPSDTEQTLGSLNRRYDLLEPGLNIKKYPCCYYTHAAIDSLSSLIEEHGLTIEDISSISCGLSPIATEVLFDHFPKTELEAKFSLPYCLAVVLFNKKPEIEHFNDNAPHRRDFQELMFRIQIYPDPELNDPNRTLGARLSIEDTKGRWVSRLMAAPRGHCSSPLPAEEVEEKFFNCAGPVLGPKKTQQVLNALRNLDQLPAIHELMSQLTETDQ